MHPIFTKVEDLNKQLLVLKSEFAAYIHDKSIPLNERWELFCKAPEGLVDESPWVWSFECVDINWYDDFMTEKYETVSFVELINDQIPEMMEDDEDETEKWEPLIPQMKEEILASNTRAFKYDW